MAVKINVNNLTLCHKGSTGASTATLPDVCKTPSPGGPVPMPYPNVTFSRDLMKGTKTVKADGGNMAANKGSEFFKSTGDEPGVGGGVVSSVNMKESTWITFSFDVKLEGKNACRLTDKKFHNHQNTVDMAGEVQTALGLADDDDEFCALCDKCEEEAGDAIANSRMIQHEYFAASRNPKVKTGEDVKRYVREALMAKGWELKTVGTTDRRGNTTAERPPGPCGELQQQATQKHEDVHAATSKKLEAQHGVDTPAFNAAWDNGKEWALDECDAHQADIDYLKQFKKECDEKC